MQCSLFLTQQPQIYTTDTSQISLDISLLTDGALEWATAVWNRERERIHLNIPTIRGSSTAGFEHSEGGRDPGENLLNLCENKCTTDDFALQFRTLLAQTTWVEDTLG